jgi:hypothetical protein
MYVVKYPVLSCTPLLIARHSDHPLPLLFPMGGDEFPVLLFRYKCPRVRSDVCSEKLMITGLGASPAAVWL